MTTARVKLRAAFFSFLIITSMVGGSVAFEGVTAAANSGVEASENATETDFSVNNDLYAGGSGTALDPYRIANWTHLNNTRKNLDANFKLVADLNDSTAGYDKVVAIPEKGFVPIGRFRSNPDVNVVSEPFTGSFDGQGYTISDLRINQSQSTGFTVNPSSDYVGLFGYISGNGEVENVGVENSTVAGSIAGGGLVGVVENGSVRESYATGSVSARTSGGLVGGVINSSVTKSYATGIVTGSNTVGGLVGVVTGTNSSVSESYATGAVIGESTTGGLVGARFQDEGTVTESYWDVEKTGQLDSAGNATGLRTSEMTGSVGVDNMSELDFTTTWDVETGTSASYPYLQNNTQQPAPTPSQVSDPGSLLYAGGSGTASDPYRIANWTHLNNMRLIDANFALVADLNKSTAGYEEVVDEPNKGFKPIGTYSDSEFAGSFNGSGHTISDLRINRPSESFIGLFGFIYDGIVKNVGIKHVNITGNDNIGGLVGVSVGNVTNSFATGNVIGNANVGGLVGVSAGNVTNSFATGNVIGNDNVGGLVGVSDNGIITTSYTTGTVTGESKVGGLVGTNGGTVSNSYTTGVVTAGSEGGGLVGNNDFGRVTDSYWDIELTGQSNSAGRGIGLTTSEMTGSAGKDNMSGLEFTSTWDIETGGSSSYPYLQKNPQNPAPTPDQISGPEILYAGGSGTVSDPYRIANWTHLNNTRKEPSANFRLIADLNENTTGYNEIVTSSQNRFTPIGDRDSPFVGQFNGNNHIISDISINRSSENHVGLFGHVGEENNGGIIKNVGVKNASITGQLAVGGLVGELDAGNITDSYAAGNISGESDVGGIVGVFDGGRNITDSYATGIVSGERDVGGLVGEFDSSRSITNSYAIENVSGGGGGNIGGLVGDFQDSRNITDSYATGTINGGGDVGGLVGELDESNVTDSYATVTVTGDYDVGGLVGDFQDSRNITDSYATGTINGRGDVGGLVGNLDESNVTDSYATVTVTGDYDVGGLVGEFDDGIIANSYATGITTGDDDDVGGLVGHSDGIVRKSYATGNVTGNNDVGGFVGANFGTVTDSYWDINQTNQTDSAGSAAGLTTSEMTGTAARTNMSGLGFENTWQVTDRYPELRAFSETNDSDDENAIELAPFSETTQPNQANSANLGGKFRVERPVASSTNVTLLENSSTAYSMNITAPDGSENVTFYLQERAISASQDTEDVRMLLDGQPRPFTIVEDAGPGNSSWIAFTVPEFSTRTVTFTTESDSEDTAPSITAPSNAIYDPNSSLTIDTSHNATGVIDDGDVAIRIVNVTAGNDTQVALNNNSVPVEGSANTTIPAGALAGNVTVETQLYNLSNGSDVASDTISLTANTTDDGGDDSGGSDGDDGTDGGNGDDGEDGDDESDGGDGTDGDTGTPSFAASGLDPQNVTVTAGDTLTVTAAIENAGGASGTQTVEYRIGETTYASKEVTLSPGENTTVEFTDIETENLVADDYEHGVFTENATQTGTLTVETDTGGGTDDSTLGFGSVASLLALVAFVLITRRERD